MHLIPKSQKKHQTRHNREQYPFLNAFLATTTINQTQQNHQKISNSTCSLRCYWIGSRIPRYIIQGGPKNQLWMVLFHPYKWPFFTPNWNPMNIWRFIGDDINNSIYNNQLLRVHLVIPYLKLKVRTCKWMVEIVVSFWARPFFRCDYW